MKGIKQIGWMMVTMVLCCLPSVSHAGPTLFYVEIEGSMQGQFKGTASRSAHSQCSEGDYFSQQVIIPIDAATGRPSGSRQHKPMTLRLKTMDAVAQLFQAAVTNESLTVTVYFMDVTADGTYEDSLIYTLDSATITSYKVVADGDMISASATKISKATSYKTIELELNYRSIEIEYLPNGSAAVDDWMAR